LITRNSETKPFSLWICGSYLILSSRFRFFSVPRSSVINPSRISSAKGMTSGRIKSTTNTTAAKASNFGKRSRDAYCISRSWIIHFTLPNIVYSNNTEGVPRLSIKFCLIKQKPPVRYNPARGFHIVTLWNTTLRTLCQRLLIECSASR